MGGGHLRRIGGGRYLSFRAAALFLQHIDSRQLQFRPASAWHSDLLGHRGDELSRRPYHGRSGLGQCGAAAAARHRRVRHPGAVVRGHGADLHLARQGDRHPQRQYPDRRPSSAHLAVLRRRLCGRRIGRAADRYPDLAAGLPPGGFACGRAAGEGGGVMSPDAVAITGFIVLFALMLLRVPVGMAMGLVGVSGFAYLVGGGPALKLVGQTSMRTVTDYTFGVIPMFLLMGAFVTASGMSLELFRAANTFVGHRRGGLGIATIVACAGFAAISGSSVATAATFSTVADPEMRRYKYPQSFATGVIAAARTPDATFSPSTVLAGYRVITQQGNRKMVNSRIPPGIFGGWI